MYGDWTEDEIEMGRHSVDEILELMERRGVRDSVEWEQMKKFASEIPDNRPCGRRQNHP
jgi:hypothetical protein